jgi:hypothetical protein
MISLSQRDLAGIEFALPLPLMAMVQNGTEWQSSIGQAD